jgi:hypothetical protein
MNRPSQLCPALPFSQGRRLIRVLDVEVIDDALNNCLIRATLLVVDLVESPKCTVLSYISENNTSHWSTRSLEKHI